MGASTRGQGAGKALGFRRRRIVRGAPVPGRTPHGRTGMEIECRQQLAAENFTSATFEQHVVGQNYRSSAVDIEDRHDVL